MVLSKVRESWRLKPSLPSSGNLKRHYETKQTLWRLVPAAVRGEDVENKQAQSPVWGMSSLSPSPPDSGHTSVRWEYSGLWDTIKSPLQMGASLKSMDAVSETHLDGKERREFNKSSSQPQDPHKYYERMFSQECTLQSFGSWWINWY